MWSARLKLFYNLFVLQVFLIDSVVDLIWVVKDGDGLVLEAKFNKFHVLPDLCFVKLLLKLFVDYYLRWIYVIFFSYLYLVPSCKDG